MKKNLIRVLAASGCLTVICIFIFFLLPFLADAFFLPKLLQHLPFDHSSASISRLSPFHVRGSLEFEHADKPVVSVPKFDIYFKPGKLFQKDIQQLVLTNVFIHLYMKDGVPTFLMDTPAPPKKQDNTQDIGKLLAALPAMVSSIRLKQCTLVLHDIKDNQLTINGAIDFDYAISNLEQIELSEMNVNLRTSGNIPILGRFSLTKEDGSYKLHVKKLQLDRLNGLSQFIPQISQEQLDGQLTIETEATLHPNTLLPEQFHGFLTAQNFFFKQSNFTIQTEENAATLQFSGNPDEISYSLAGLQFNSGWQATLATEGSIYISPEITGQGNLALVAADEQNNIPFTGDYSFAAQKQDQIKLTANLASKKHIHLQLNENQINLAGIAVSLTTEKEKDMILAKIALSATDISIPFSEKSAAISTFTVDTQMEIKNEIITGALQANIPAIQLPEVKANLTDTSLSLPFNIDLKDSKPFPTGKGSFSINTFEYGGEHLASYASNLTYQKNLASLSGQITTPLQQDLFIKTTGKTDFIHSPVLSVQMDKTGIISDDYAPYLPIPDILSFDGELAFFAELTGNNFPRAEASINITNGNANLYESETYFTGITASLNFPSLPQLQSSPSQIITIDNMDVGALDFTNAEILFRLEDATSLFIEKSKLHWCGGQVESGSLRLSTANNEIDTTLYCDRLGFAELLEQFGIEGTEGKGSLNGKLPIHFSDAGIHFDNGFLFSTPGESGIMHFNNTDMIKAGMPNLDQTATLSYSLQALEDFSYDWSRLTFASNEDVLTLTMELKGQPAKPLPFGYSGGQIVNDPTGPGLQHPVRLDLNFNLPQEDIFRYGKNLQSFKENL